MIYVKCTTLHEFQLLFLFLIFQMSEDVRTLKALLKEADISADDAVVHTLLDYQYCKWEL